MTRPRFLRRDLGDPRTMAHFLRTGVIWQLPMLWPDAMRAIREGVVPLAECKDVPEQVRDLLGSQ